MNEAETRAEHIDPALKAAGWGIVEGSKILREHRITDGRIEGRGKRGRRDIADYVLVYRNTKLAVVEAKAWDEELTEGVGQAKSYAGKLAIRHTYATNGQGIYAIDMETGVEGAVSTYPTPDELWAMTFAKANAWRDRFAAVPTPDKSGSWTLRFYQEIAVRRVLEKIAAGEPRILLTLATGTGKTSIAFQIAWKLFQARWNLREWKTDGEPSRRPRILFLADRNTLATQAYNDFTSFAAFADDALVRVKPEDIRKKGAVPKNASLFFTIFQTFMSGPVKDGKPSPYFGEYPPDFFDFIVIDECHRGGANDESTWRDILEYFAPAVQLGLTATPKRKDNVDTYAYFGEPVYIYSLKEGINDGFLTPFRVKQIQTTIDYYVYTSDDAVVEGEIEAGKLYEEADFNRSIEIREREKKRVEIFLSQINQNEKTLVFCANQAHALLVRDLINQLKTSKDPNYCQRVTADDGALGEEHLRNFQDNEKTIPTILTTSQKLSTGVDARNIRNIVLLRPINSMIEFKQIIGRGTRLFEGKDYFTIYDFVKAHLKFQDPEWDGPPQEEKPCPKCGQRPCACVVPPPKPCEVCGKSPCECPSEPCAVCGQIRCVCEKKKKVKVKLADGKERTIQHMIMTTFWHPDGTPMSSQEFIDLLYGEVPDFFQSEEELRKLWSAPDTRAKLLAGLAEKDFGHATLLEMQKIIGAEKSDIYDVLAYVAYDRPPVPREVRADHARVHINSQFNAKQQAFLDFVLAHYVSVGVEELEQQKLTPLLRLKYHNSIADAVADLGKPEEIGEVFAGFQKYLYEQVA
ncbi:MAG: DEAD/DEAH box helicase family protein [Chthoniobacter sp.]|nr:DEAD/DEAH box helicase family protein [Chthoniobacter sp.]